MGKKLAVITGIVVLLALAGAVAWLFISGKLVWASQTNQSGTVKIVCGNDQVTAFNAAFDAVVRDDSDELTVDQDGQRKVAADIRTLSGYENDPTCQAILLNVAYLDDDEATAKSAFDAIKSAHEQNIFINNNLSGIMSLDRYNALVLALSPENQGKGRNGDEL